MISAKQLAANRANAHFSTGPVTPEGKARTRLNAVQHGLTGQVTIVAPSEQAAFTGLSDRLTADLKPSGEQELQIAARIVRDTWRLSRSAAHQDTIYALGLIENGRSSVLSEEGCHDHEAIEAAALVNARTFFSKLRDFNLAGLYEQRIHRTLMKDYALLRQLQQDRKREETMELARPRPAVLVKTAAANGSDFSNLSELPSVPPDQPKIAPDRTNSALSHFPLPAKTLSQAPAEATHAA